jgi:energy-coupling factor transporter ATP-binding protein EcfA2
VRLERLWVKDYKNLRNCEIEFREPRLLNALIGDNGSGKSNLIEAILQILIGVYFKSAPPFDFVLSFEAQGRLVRLNGEARKLSVYVDGEPKPLDFFAEQLRQGDAQVYYPELTLVYYSGDCRRVNKLMSRYRRHFERLTREPESDRLRPLFVQPTNQQAKLILLALYAHRRLGLLDRLGIRMAIDTTLVLQSPPSFDPAVHEPKLWDTVGAVRRVVAAIDETASWQESRRKARGPAATPEDGGLYTERRTYRFNDEGLRQLADRLEQGYDNLYLALEHLRARRLFVSASYQLVGRTQDEPFDFDQLSEGEKQLLAVLGAIELTNRPDNLVLLDEPDTHLNPKWTWDYPSMLTEAFDAEQQRRSMVLVATHTPIMISGMTSDQVLLAQPPSGGATEFKRPRRDPRGQGIANLLCSSEYFDLPSSLDKETQKLMDERLAISVKEALTDGDRDRLRTLNGQLEMSPGISERDPDFVAFLRQQHPAE